MKLQSKIFDKSNFKGLTPELENEIIRRFNDYDTLTRVMLSTAENLQTLVRTSNNMETRDINDICLFIRQLRDATNKLWLKENKLYF